MRWLAKAVVQGMISALPRGYQINYLMQRHVSRRLPASMAQFDLHVRAAAQHLTALDAARPGVDRGALTCYEFGAGWDLIGPITMWALGIEKQIIIDIRPHVKLDLVNGTLDTFSRRAAQLESLVGERVRSVDPTPVRTIGELARRFGIRYVAPADARWVPMPDGCIDFVSSTFTLEHIPRDEIAAILEETHRVLADDGVISSAIDMQDHYHYIDDDVTVYNFLRYSPRAWRLLNPGLQWQSRLRHSEYLDLFRRAGYEIVADNPELPTQTEQATLQQMKVADAFEQFDLVDLGTKATHLVVRKRLGSAQAHESPRVTR